MEDNQIIQLYFDRSEEAISQTAVFFLVELLPYMQSTYGIDSSVTMALFLI